MPTAKDLAHLTASLHQFQEDCFGISAENPPMYRLPGKIFKDLRPNSVLVELLHGCYEYKHQHQWRRFEFLSQIKKQSNIDLFIWLETRLKEKNLLKYPHIFFHQTVNQTYIESIRPSLSKLRITETNNPSQATHILVPYINYEQQDQEWYRTVEKTEKKGMVHWWYYPDSYDEWVSSTEMNLTDPEPAPQHTGPWVITTRWLDDGLRFNEWMNEEDYEPEQLPDDLKTYSVDSASSSTSLNKNPQLMEVRTNKREEEREEEGEEGEEEEKEEDAENENAGEENESKNTEMSSQTTEDKKTLDSLENKIEYGSPSKDKKRTRTLSPETETPKKMKSSEPFNPPQARGASLVLPEGQTQDVNLQAYPKATPTSLPTDSEQIKILKMRQSEYEPIQGGTITNISQPEDQSSPALKKSNSSNDVQMVEASQENVQEQKKIDESKIQSKIELLLSQQTEKVIIPSYSSWFDFASFHEVLFSFLFSLFFSLFSFLFSLFSFLFSLSSSFVVQHTKHKI